VSTTVTAPGDVAAWRDEARSAVARTRRWGSFYVAESRMRSMRAYGWTIVVGAVGQPLLYLLGLGVGLAAFIQAPIAAGPSGSIGYTEFVAPALLASAAVGVAMEEFTYVIMEGFRWRKTFWAINATSVTPRQACNGIVLSVAARMLVTGAAYYAIAVAFSAIGRPVAGLAMPLVGLLGGLAFGLPVMAFAARMKEDTGQFSIIQRFIFTPLFLFSGTFYPLASLPLWLQWIGWISPVWHASELGRALSFGATPGGWPWWTHLLVLLVMIAGGAALAWRSFVRRMTS
jgi:lipooligosaccharide transport system permease protein